MITFSAHITTAAIGFLAALVGVGVALSGGDHGDTISLFGLIVFLTGAAGAIVTSEGGRA